MDPAIALPAAAGPEPRALAMTGLADEPDDVERAALAALDRADREAALTILMRAYGAPLYRYCRRMVADEELAQDAHQMSFVQAYEGLGGFTRRSSLRPWLFGIARHRCLDAVKVDRRRRRRFGRLGEVEDRQASGADPEAELATRSLEEALAACVGELAPRIRAAVLLRFQQGLSYVQIAALTGERAPALQARVARALPVLRRCLEERGLAP
jgi:RNA polymerase sigma-70 factor (ECF subfamily)